MESDGEDAYARSYKTLIDTVPGQLLFNEQIEVLHLASALLHDQDRVEDAIAGAASEQSGLERHELIWTALYPHLERCGYTLRPRYAPGWRYTGPLVDGLCPRESRDIRRVRLVDEKHWAQYPDAEPLSIFHFLTARATCIKMGEPVVLKLLCSRPGHDNEHELEILQLLNSPPLRHHPDNVCVPVREFLDLPPLPSASDFSLVVMPVLRPLVSDDCDAFSTGLSLMQQGFEGLAFLHSLGIAHGDIAMCNIMLSGDKARPQLYLIDFGLARHFYTPITTWKGGNTGPPEARRHGDTYDPFKGDVFALAVIFYEVRRLLCCRSIAMNNFVVGIRQQDPEKRFTAAEAVDALERGIRSVSAWYDLRASCRVRKLSRVASMCRKLASNDVRSK